MTSSRDRQPRPVAERRLDIDHLRNLTVMLLIAFHSARLFDAEAWHMKHLHVYRSADVFIALMNQWGMPLLFPLDRLAIRLPRCGLI